MASKKKQPCSLMAYGSSAAVFTFQDMKCTALELEVVGESMEIETERDKECELWQRPGTHHQ